MYAKKSANARLDYVRSNHKSPSNALLEKAVGIAEPMQTEAELQTPAAPKRGGNESRESSPDLVLPGCICNRKAKTLVCGNCKMFTYGRIAKNCEWHRNVTYLMDFIYCPHCLGPSESLRSVDLDYDVYQSINATLTKKF